MTKVELTEAMHDSRSGWVDVTVYADSDKEFSIDTEFEVHGHNIVAKGKVESYSVMRWYGRGPWWLPDFEEGEVYRIEARLKGTMEITV